MGFDTFLVPKPETFPGSVIWCWDVVKVMFQPLWIDHFLYSGESFMIQKGRQIVSYD